MTMELEALTDPDLVSMTLAGDDQAFATLVNRHQRITYNVCYRMLGDGYEAEDAAQEAFLRAFRYLDRYDPGRSFKTWLLSIASNHCIDRLRQRRMTKLSIDDLLPWHPALTSHDGSPERATMRHERSDIFQAMLEELTPQYRVVLVFYYWYDMSCKEIAETLEIEEGTVKSRLHRARKKLAGQFIINDVPASTLALESI
jgi:RNA polymerase sigma-70 factor (ECF subfamily)